MEEKNENAMEAQEVAATPEVTEETTVMPKPVEESASGHEEQAGDDTTNEVKPKRHIPRIAFAGAAVVLTAALCGGAWYASRPAAPTNVAQEAKQTETRPKPKEKEPAAEATKKPVESAIDEEAVAAIVNDMGLPKTSTVEVEVGDGRLVIREEAQLVDKLVAERTYDRAYELAGEVKESQADTVTWVLDNGKGATAAVTIKVDDDRDESKAPTDVAGKLASAEGYSLNEGAYDPVKATVKEPTAGEMPVSTEGDELVKPAKKAEEAPASESSSRTPSTDAAASTSSGRNTSSTSSSSGTSMTRDSGSSSSSSSSSSRPSSSGSSSGSSSSSSSSSEPAKHWVEEKGHWEDTYESQEVKTGTRWVVDQAAWDEDVYETVHVWYTSDGMRFTDLQSLESYMYEQLLAGNDVSCGDVSEDVYTGTVHHDEVGHYEDVYETQQVKTGSTWVVDVPGHWE